jgi:predicted anti-sigma-YlaC factor YlaD
MTRHDCPRELDVLDAVESRRWPGRAPDLQAHVAECQSCADLAAVAAALLTDRQAAWDEAADVPPSGVVWWRSQLRARIEAERLASRPIAVVHVMAGVVLLAAAIAVGSLTFERGAAFGVSLLSKVTAMAAVATVIPDSQVVGVMLHAASLAVGVTLALVPLAILIATDE